MGFYLQLIEYSSLRLIARNSHSLFLDRSYTVFVIFKYRIFPTAVIYRLSLSFLPFMIAVVSIMNPKNLHNHPAKHALANVIVSINKVMLKQHVY